MTYELISTTVDAHDEAIWAVDWAVNENSKVENIVTASLDDTVKSWRWEEDRLEANCIFEGHSLGVVSVDINQSGSIAASNSLDSHIRLWDLESGNQVRSIDAGPVNAWTVVFSPDSEFVATSTQAGKIFLYSTKTGEKLEKELDSNGKFPLCLTIRKDGKQLAGGAVDGMARIYDIETGQIVSTLEGHGLPIRSITFSDDGNYLITGSEDCYVKVYDLRGEVMHNLAGHGSWVLSLTFSPDNQHFASSSSDKTVKIWSIDSKESLHTFANHKDQVWGVKYSPCGRRLVSVSEDKSIAVYSVG